MQAKFKHTFSLNGVRYEKDQVVDLDKRTFQALAKRGVVEEHKKKTAPKKDRS